MKRLLSVFCAVIAVTICIASPLFALTDVNNYCVVPPFVQQAIKPNLLLMMDNSASMFDLAYADKGTATRVPTYCYDNTYSDANATIYAGYFEPNLYYNFNISSATFELSTDPGSGSCTYYIANKYCIATDTASPKRVTRFSASGNYLNWLTASKFDIQKKILTGGKLDGSNLVAESRGCVGRGFIKQPLSTNSGNYVEGGTNTPTGIAIQVSGAHTSYDEAAPSQGGQTYIYFYLGATSTPFNNDICKTAIGNLTDGTSMSGPDKQTVLDCIGASGGSVDLSGKKKQIFNQSLQECWQYNDNLARRGNLDQWLTDDSNVKRFCAEVYQLRDTDHGPLAFNPGSEIKAGDADLLCSTAYVGACYSGTRTIALLNNTPAPGLLDFLLPKSAYAAAPVAGNFQFSAANYSVLENAGTATMTITRTGGCDGAATVSYKTDVGGTATAGVDYTAKTGTVAFANNSCVSQTFTVSITNDTLTELNETINLTLTGTTAGALGAQKTAVLTILDDDGPPPVGTIALSSATYSVSEGAGTVTITVSRTGGSAGAIGVSYATSNGTATAAINYTAASGTLSWANGDASSKTFTVPITYNSVTGNKTFNVTLSAVTGGATLGSPNAAVVTIIDDGSVGSIDLSSATYAISQTSTPLTVTVRRTGGNWSAVSVTYATANGTAVSGTNYTATSGTLSWASGDSADKTFTIPILNAGSASDTTFTVSISSASGGTIVGALSSATVTITGTVPGPGAWSSVWTGCSGGVCGDPCVKQKHAEYCGGMATPPVTDPTDAPGDTAVYGNLPAVLADMAIGGQLGAPLKILSGTTILDAIPVKLAVASISNVKGLIQAFAGKIRVGLMSFNYNGSSSECADGSAIPCPKICSTDSAKTCSSYLDCCSNSNECSCDPSTKDTTNLDGAKILYPVGLGTCSNDSGVACATDDNCSLLLTSGTCTMAGSGNHSSGLVYEIDALKAANWTPFSEGFYNAIGYFARTAPKTSRTALRINPVDPSNTNQPVDFASDMNPSQYACQQNYVLLISDGVSTADRKTAVSNLASTYKSLAGLTGGDCTAYSGSSNLPVLSWLARNRNISNFSTTDSTASAAPTQMRDKITTYVVFNGQDNGVTGECNSNTLLSNTATKGGGKYYHAENPTDLQTALVRAFEEISAGVSSGTAASIVNNRGESGSNLLQAVFYPMKEFTGGTALDWIGEMQNLWYFLDPFLQKNTIREDSVYGSVTKDYRLNLLQDYVIETEFNNTTNVTEAKRFSDNGSGTYTLVDTITADAINALWKAGDELHKRNVSYTSATTRRKIYTNLGSGLTLLDSTAASGDLPSWGHVQEWLQASDYANAKDIIDYTNGFDITGYRSRRVNYNGVTTAATTGLTTGVGVWKLGDIVSSTPQVQSAAALQQYYDMYADATYKAFTSTAAYAARNMVYVGSNDGMLHAFKMGSVAKDTTPAGQKAHITDTTNLGKEEWAFVPQNALPYLQYLMSPSYAGKNHVFTVDGTSTLVDVSTAKPAACLAATNYSECTKTVDSWKTLLIGGMGTGGATRPSNGSCNYASDCIKGPVTVSGKESAGLSAYFALDVTTPTTPVLKWEFNHPELGLATTGPSVVRVSDSQYKNGKWFAVFASGPTGPIDTASRQMLGRSDQTLKLFVVDLGTTSSTIATGNGNLWIIDTGIPYAFSGSQSNSTLDAHRSDKSSSSYYSDDAVYLGYVQPKSVDTSVTPNVPDWSESRGGVLRVLTKNSTNPALWSVTKLIENDPSAALTDSGGIGPVTTSITKLQDKTNKKLWLFFGTGRYFYKDYSGVDQGDQRQKLFGVMDPCYTSDNGLTCENYCQGNSNLTCTGNSDCGAGGTCITPTVTVDKSKLNNQDSAPSVNLATDETGWYITMGASAGGDNGYKAERLITDPKAATNGVVYFTTFTPATNLCGFGGQTYLWAVNYNSGSQPASSALLGKALIQVSTGSFVPIDLKSAFTAQEGRRTATGVTGVPPKAQGLTLITRPQPVKKILHIQER